MMSNKVKVMLRVAIPIIIALISAFGVSKFATSVKYHAQTIESLDDKITTVMELTAASTASSAAISVIPGDAGTPIANKLADLSTYFLLVLCAIYLEKYLLTITGFATFVILIPLACLLFSVNTFIKNKTCTYLAIKMALFGLAIALVIPSSVAVSNMIEATYNSSIQETIESAKQTTEAIEESKEEDEEGFLSGIISSIKDGVTGATIKLETVLNNFIEALAVMLVTSCVIPIVVLLFFVWLVKAMLGVNVGLPRLTKGERYSKEETKTIKA